MERLRRLSSQWEPTFFGLGISAREAFLEHSFVLQYYLGMSYADSRAMPIRYRNWFIDRLAKEIENKRSAMSDSVDDTSARSARPLGVKHF